jgi:hypothetical protein
MHCSLRTLLTAIYITPNQQKLHLKYTNMGNLYEGAAYPRICSIPLKITHSASYAIFKNDQKVSVIRNFLPVWRQL